MKSSKSTERRNDSYPFQSLRELIVHFSDFLPMQKIESTIQENALIFSCRRTASREEERLQFIKRCESSLKADLVMLQEAFARKAPSRPAANP
jgi:hypothetical protein